MISLWPVCIYLTQCPHLPQGAMKTDAHNKADPTSDLIMYTALYLLKQESILNIFWKGCQQQRLKQKCLEVNVVNQNRFYSSLFVNVGLIVCPLSQFGNTCLY